MYGVWSLLREKANCSRKDCTEVFVPKRVKERKVGRGKGNPARYDFLQETHKSSYLRREPFHELDIGDTSRNVIEMIFSTMSTRKPVKKLERVIKVTNPPETLERFEEYRELVKKSAGRSFNRKEPRTLVDGNELLRFYQTTMSCCPQNETKVRELCSNSTCGVCQIVRRGFGPNDVLRLRGTKEEKQGEDDDDCCRDGGKRENVKKAVLLCRLIAGRLVDDMVEEGRGERFDLSEGQVFLDRSPKGILPCFVIVCS